MTTLKRKRRRYTEDFKREAVALVTEQGYSVAEAARSLDVGENQIRRWRQKFEQESAQGELSSTEREELERLRKEIRQLRMEKEILKKARVDSIGQCNTTCSNQQFGGMLHGTIRSPGYDRRTETRGLVSLA